MRFVVLAILLVGIPSQALAQGAPRSSGMQEGVTVHGDWVIEVRNPDGTLAHGHAFRNALVGGPLLAMVMARTLVPGAWTINLEGDACVPSVLCRAREAAGEVTVSLAPGGAQVVLTGTVTATAPTATQFFMVGTDLAVCDPGQIPSANCPSITEGHFSSVALATPIPITAGQMARVTVTFSFS